MSSYRDQSRSNAYRRRRAKVAKRVLVGTVIVLVWIIMALLMIGISDSYAQGISPMAQYLMNGGKVEGAADNACIVIGEVYAQAMVFRAKGLPPQYAYEHVLTLIPENFSKDFTKPFPSREEIAKKVINMAYFDTPLIPERLIGWAKEQFEVSCIDPDGKYKHQQPLM